MATTRTYTRLATIALGGALASTLAAAGAMGCPAPASAPTVQIRPGALTRGADVALPRVQGARTIVDGDVRIRVDAPRIDLVGASGTAYVVTATAADGYSHPRTLRVSRDGTTKELFSGVDDSSLRISDDGTRLAGTSQRRNQTRVRTWSAQSGGLRGDRTFRGAVAILDLDGRRVVLGGYGPNRTFRWNTVAGSTKLIARRSGFVASISADRLARFTRDTFQGGCTVVTRLSKPGVELWRSCRERVDSFSPRGTRMSTVDILSDGIGPSRVLVRRISGSRLATYSVKGYFGALTWESERALLLDTYGPEKAATVRCEVGDCERATALRPATWPRSTG